MVSQNSNKTYVQNMFNTIAQRYDFLNHFLSFGMDFYWRKTAIKHLGLKNNCFLLDLATGTGDLALTANRKMNAKVIGLDFAFEMLHLGMKKVKLKNKNDNIMFVCSDIENISLKSGIFDGVIIAFGIRNVNNKIKGMSEMYRLLKPAGKIAILEFSRPRKRLFRSLYYFYFRNILPVLGSYLSKDNSAYYYLPDSVLKFPDQNDFLSLMRKTGFRHNEFRELTMGIASVYLGEKLR